MQIELLFVHQKDLGSYKTTILQLLLHCDNDFVPPLTKRDSSYRINFDSSVLSDVPLSYQEELMNQHFIMALHNSEIVAFLTFKHGYVTDELSAHSPCNYGTTTCVYKQYRNQGIAQKLYRFLEDEIPSEMKLGFVARRTWSTNHSQITYCRDTCQ